MTREQVWATHFFGVPLELKLLLGAAVLGAFLGAVYDVLRAFRLSFRHPAWAVFLEDLSFALAFGFSFFTFSVALCRGEIRAFVLGGMCAGFFAYLVTLGRIVSKAVAFSVKCSKKFLKHLGILLKKAAAVLFVMPFFMKKAKKMQENPCKDPIE